jgi:uncharacterized protein
MLVPERGCRLRLYLGESDQKDGRTLYEWLVLEAKRRGLSGATVFRGLMGFGAKSHLHSFKIERLSLDLPIVVELIDRRDVLEEFLSAVTPALTDGIAVLDDVEVRRFGAARHPAD